MNFSEIGTLARSFNWHNPSWDLFIFLFWAVGSIIYSFTAGRGRVINILMSTYIAKLLVSEAPFIGHTVTKGLPSTLVNLQQLVTFLVVFIVLFALLGRYAFRASVDSHRFGSMVFSLIFSFLQIGLLINIILRYLPAATQQNFSPLVQLIFIKDPVSFIWLLIPLVFLIVLGKHLSDPQEI